jgi:hypothetical protein
MDEIFLSQPDLTNQTIGYLTLNISQMAAALSRTAHALLGMWW